MSKIHAVWFEKNNWTLKQTNKWLMKHNYIPIKPVHQTDRFYKYRLTIPDKRKGYATLIRKKGIRLVIEFTKKRGGRIRFPQ